MSLTEQEVGHDEALEAQTGSRVPFTMVGDWVLLSDLSPQAKVLYALLAAHVNVQSGDRKVWPGKEQLAGWLGFKQPRSIDQYLDELADLGAVKVVRVRDSRNMRDRNVYYVEGEPPASLATPLRFSDYYAERNAKRAGQDVVRSSALRSAPQRKPASGDVERPSAPRSAPEHQDVVRQSAPELDEWVELDEEGSLTTSPADPRSAAEPPDEPSLFASLELVPKPKPPAKMTNAELMVGFDEFYAEYPLHKGKQDAQKAWLQTRRKGVEVERLISAAKRYAIDTADRDPSMKKYPAGWLRDGYYDDEPANDCRVVQMPRSTADRRMSEIDELMQRRAAARAASTPGSAADVIRRGIEAPR